MKQPANNLARITGRRKLFRMIIPSFPTFNVYSSVARTTTSLGAVMIGSVVNKLPGWEVEIIDENNYHRHDPGHRRGKPNHYFLEDVRSADAVGFYGGLTSTAPRIYELARFYRKQGITSVAGGQHFLGDNIREALENNVDYVVIGEGEETIAELLTTLDRGEAPDQVAGIAFQRGTAIIQTDKREEIQNIDSLPLPDFSLLHHARLSVYPISWTRGCGMHCEFCTVKGKVRCPSVDYIFNQITSLYERLNAKFFFIVDDLFGQRRELTLEFCRRLQEYQAKMRTKFHLTIQIRLDKGQDTELLNAIRRAGGYIAAIGYESPLSEELESMNKKLDQQKLFELTRAFHKAGFMVHGMFIFGYPAKPGQHYELGIDQRIKAYKYFIKKARLDTIQILLPVPLPGTDMTKRLADAGRLFPLKTIDWKYYDGNFPLFRPDPPLTPSEMYQAVKKLMGWFYKFRYMFSIGMNIICFPAILFPVFNVKAGWTKWYRSWRNNLWRFVGWILIKKWNSGYKKDNFAEKLESLEKNMTNSLN